MKINCTNCGKEIEIQKLRHDEINPDGFYINCSNCGASFDIDERIIMEKMFITDIAKMADFKILTKEDFLASYSYLTEDEYNATALYYNWLVNREES